MDFGGIPLIGLIKQRMDWLSRRQDVLSQNVASANVPGYKARDLKPVDFSQMMKESENQDTSALTVTNPRHIKIERRGPAFEGVDAPSKEATQDGNSVSLEAEMIKVADTQAQYQAAANLYAKTISMMRTAIDRGGV